MYLRHGKWNILLSVLCLMAGTILTVSSCAPAGSGGSGGETLGLSHMRVNPGEFVTLSHDGISANSEHTVEFKDAAGVTVRVLAFAEGAGELDVAVPVHVDAAAGTMGAGQWTVSIQNLSGEATIDVNDLHTLPGVAPGAIFKAFLEVSIAEYERTLENLNTMGQQFGPEAGAEAVAALNARVAEVQSTLDELESTGELQVDLGELGVTTLSGESLVMADRLLVNMIAGIDENSGVAAKESVRRRGVDECIPNPPSGLTIEECMREVINDILRRTQSSGTRLAGYLATGVGVTITIFGLVTVATPTVVLTGVLVSVAGGAVAVADAGLQGQNTDAFLQSVGDDFDIGLEIMSQSGRVLISAVSSGASALENGFATALDALDKGVTAFDAYSALKCDDDDGNQKGLVRSQSIEETIEDIQFCTIVRPPGCENSCATAFNAICEDGGTGSTASSCSLGTDCTDCGARGSDSNGADAVCCTSNGDCGLMSSTACLLIEGTVMENATTCTPNPCLQPSTEMGACCVSGVTCTDVTAAACANINGGVYSGDGSDCTNVVCTPPVEYVIWYTGNVCCWGAPLMYIGTRESFEEPGSASSYPGGGIDPSVPVVKVEFQGGFASVEEARAWVCPQFESSTFHFWCTRHYQLGGQNWQPGSLGCDLNSLPEASVYPEVNGCE